ncbi:uncharacterized protein LOC144773006 isoform X2 [Lissotriton helveticus]
MVFYYLKYHQKYAKILEERLDKSEHQNLVDNVAWEQQNKIIKLENKQLSDRLEKSKHQNLEENVAWKQQNEILKRENKELSDRLEKSKHQNLEENVAWNKEKEVLKLENKVLRERLGEEERNKNKFKRMVSTTEAELKNIIEKQNDDLLETVEAMDTWERRANFERDRNLKLISESAAKDAALAAAEDEIKKMQAELAIKNRFQTEHAERVLPTRRRWWQRLLCC